jgi:sugar phosphate isomerase/epimerase
MKIGFAGYSWPGHYGQRAELSLEQGAAAGLEVMQFLEPTALSPELRAARLAEIRAAGASLGLELEIGITYLELAGDRPAATVLEKLEACLEAGFTELSTLTKLDRFDAIEPMTAQLDRLTAALESVGPMFERHGAHLNLETHEDLTSDEVVGVIERLDPEIFGVTLDIANFAVNAEDPIAATRRVAPWVRQTHLEDLRLHLVPSGIRRLTCPVGQGILDWAAVVAIVAALERPPNLCVELHRGQFQADVFEPRWIERHPDLRVAELASQLAAAASGAERRGGPALDRGPWPVPYGSAPHSERVAAIQTGATRLREELMWSSSAARLTV